MRDHILSLVRARSGQSGIVYCLSRKSVEATAEFLRDHRIRALAYHAGMESADRTRAQDAFRHDDADVICATVAFGMGIDKSNIRYVIHRDMPKSIEGYYQEIGRAGRDGVPSDCILFYSWADVISYDRFADQAESPEVAEQHRRQTREMYRYAESAGCRHQILVNHFGEKMGPCGAACDLCTGSDRVAEARERGRSQRRTATEERRTKKDKSPTAATLESPKAGRYIPDTVEDPTGSVQLFQRLKQLRRKIADEKDVAAYIVFSDYTLLEMARACPQTEEELRAVPGVGPKKLAQYGEAFLKVIKEG